MRKISVFLICFLMIFMNVFTVYADMGPKPSTVVTLVNPPSGYYELEILSNGKVVKSDINDNVISGSGGFLDLLPDTFSVRVKTDEGFYYSETINPRAFNAEVSAYIMGGRIILFEESASLLHSAHINFFNVLSTVLITVIIELIIFRIFGISLKWNYTYNMLLVIGANILTQFILWVLSLIAYSFSMYNLITLLIFEIIVFLVEWFIYNYNKNEALEFELNSITIYAIVANLVTFLATFILPDVFEFLYLLASGRIILG